MGILSFFKKKQFFSAVEKQQLENAIHTAEKETCARIVLYIESKNYLLDPVERAKEVFAELKMKQTKQHDAVLIYIAVKHRELALYADYGIYDKVGKEFWENAIRDMITHFKGENMVQGIENCIAQIGHTLKEKFPYDGLNSCNEFPDDIVMGK
jgi:uncharacterized membrane protein YgcG